MCILCILYVRVRVRVRVGMDGENTDLWEIVIADVVFGR